MKYISSLFAILATVSASTNLTTHLQTCSGHNIGQLFGHKSTCTKFLQCTPIGLLTFNCQKGTYFDPNTRTCECGLNKTCRGQRFDHCPLTVQTDICVGRKVGEILDHPFSCTAFYQCSHYGPALYECPDGAAFNAATRTCDSARNVKCARLGGLCCGSAWLTGCCDGVMECRPCGISWLDPKLCCIPCIKCHCMSCPPTNGPTAPTPCGPKTTTPPTTTATTTRVHTTTPMCPCATTSRPIVTTTTTTTTPSCPCAA